MKKIQIALLGHGALHFNYFQRELENNECVGIFVTKESIRNEVQEIVHAVREHFYFQALSFSDSHNVIVMRIDDCKKVEHIFDSAGLNKIEPIEFIKIENTLIDRQTDAEILENTCSLLTETKTKIYLKMNATKNAHLINKITRESRARVKRRLNRQCKVINETAY